TARTRIALTPSKTFCGRLRPRRNVSSCLRNFSTGTLCCPAQPFSYATETACWFLYWRYASPRRRRSWQGDGACLICEFIASSWLLKLHLRNSLVRLNDLVANLHHQLKRQIGFLDRHHCRVYVLAVSLQQFTDLCRRIVLQRIHLAQHSAQSLRKFWAAAA